MKTALCGLTLAMLGACGAIVEPKDRVKVDRFAELLIVDDALLSGEGESSAVPSEQIASFGTLWRAAAGAQQEVALARWLSEWESVSDAPAFVYEQVRCRWLRATQDNQCDPSCGRCAERRLDPDKAPFRLIGVSYRPDLALATGEPQLSKQECRLVFALSSDARASDPNRELAVSVIFELRLTAPAEAASWAERFHSLSPLSARPPAFRRALSELVADAVQAPKEVSLRLRDDAFSNGQMLAWQLGPRELTRVGLANTVDPAQASQSDLRAHLLAQRDDLERGEPNLPAAWRRSEVSRATPLPETGDPALDPLLAVVTCQGCHGDERTIGGFHLAPRQANRQRVSRFLHDPEHPADDELARREDALRTLLALTPGVPE